MSTRSAALINTINFFVLLGSLTVSLLLLFCLINERGTYILILFSCKLTNENDEKFNTGRLNTTGRQMQLTFPKSNSNLRWHCPKKRCTRKRTVFSSWIIFDVVVVFFFSFSIFCLQYSPPLLMLVILVLLMNHDISISFCDMMGD